MEDRLRRALKHGLTGIKDMLRHSSDKRGREEMEEVGRQIGDMLREVLPYEVQVAVSARLPREEATETGKEIYTDGSCAENPGGPGGWAFVVVGEENEERVGHVATTERPVPTNNRMELRAILEALKSLPRNARPQIFSDSKYAVLTSNQTWDSKQNLDLLRPIWDQVKRTGATFDHVEGHAGHKHNERADTLARQAAFSNGSPS